jgi:dihydrofolate reductase
VINIIGYIMMIGGGSDNPKEFNEAELFSDMRITVSPIVIVVGIALIIYGIMKKSKLNNQED